MADDYQVLVADAVGGKNISMFGADAAFAVRKFPSRYSYVPSPPHLNNVNVLDFGAIGDGVSDDTDALERASIAAAAHGTTLIYPPGYTFLITSTHTIRGSCYGVGAVIQTRLPLAPAVDVNNGTSQYFFYKTFYLPDVLQLSPTWAAGDITGLIGQPGGFSALECGIRITNATHCSITYSRIRSFYVGFYMFAQAIPGKAGACAYNTVFIGATENNKINILSGTDNNTTSALASWCNQNILIGGSCSFFAGVSVLGTRHVLIDASSSIANALTFIGQSLEGNTPEIHIDNYGEYVRFDSIRYEASLGFNYNRGSTTVTCTDATTISILCRNDLLVGGYHLASIVTTDSSGGSGYCQLDTFKWIVNEVVLSGAGGLLCSGGPMSSHGVYIYASLPTAIVTPVTLTTGNGSPEGVLTANKGSQYYQQDAVDGTCCTWEKRSGMATNTGWVLGNAP